MPSTVTQTTRERWGEQLRVARVLTKQSQAAVGRATNLQGPTVSRAERGIGSLDVFDKLARHYAITLEAGDAS